MKIYQSFLLFLCVLLITNCTGDYLISNKTLRSGTYKISKLPELGLDSKKMMRHGKIKNFFRFRFDYNTKKKNLFFWAEIWERNQLRINRLLHKTTEYYGDSETKASGLGSNSLIIELSKSDLCTQEFERSYINIFFTNENF